MRSPISNWRNKERYQYLGKTGKIVSFTKINNPPKGFGRVPYYVAMVEFKNGKKKTGQLVLKGEELKIGAKVKAVIRIIETPDKEGIINYGVKFKVLK